MSETYKVVMRSEGKVTQEWIVMDAGTSKPKMKIVLDWYRDNLPQRVFRMEKHTMTVVDY